MGINIERQMAHWRASAEEDWEVGLSLVQQGKPRHGLFFIHLALEKALKAHVWRTTQNFPPKIHTLLTLAQKAILSLSQNQEDFLAQFDRFNIAGRYPGFWDATLTQTEANEQLARAREMYQWLTQQF